MDATQSRVIGAGLFFLFIFLTGFWLGRSQKPYNAIRLNIHKLIGLAAGIFLIVTVYQINKAAPLGPAEIAVVAVTVLLFAGTVVAGGLVSIDKPMPAAISTVHKALPYLAVLGTGATLYLLLGPN